MLQIQTVSNFTEETECHVHRDSVRDIVKFSLCVCVM